jgi:sodium-dependent dicarboxylate transporter 2/3/5
MHSYSKAQLIGLISGPVLSIIVFLLPVPDGMSIIAWHTTAIALLMAVYWISEAIPMYVTSLIPIILFPLLNIGSIKATTTPYGHPLIFLFLGGFILAKGIEKWGLHKRIALGIIKYMGFKPVNIIAGFMLGSAFLSMWISNTATALMMLPIGMFVISIYKEALGENKNTHNFTLALLLSIAYAASIGGVGTLIGTPPNALLSAFMTDTYDVEISFAKWTLIGFPFVIISLPIVFILLTKVIFPIYKMEKVDDAPFLLEMSSLGKISKEEKIVLSVFAFTALLWMTRKLLVGILPGLSDAGIAVLGALVLFTIPVKGKGFIIEWKDVQKISWGILILFGGGLSLAQGIKNSGLSEWIATAIFSNTDISILTITIILTTAIVFLTELTSNSATTAAFLPVIGSIAVGLNSNPLELLVPITMAASCAFMLPVATPPNAIVFSSGEVRVKDMSRAGFILNIVFVFIVVAITQLLGPIIFNY